MESGISVCLRSCQLEWSVTSRIILCSDGECIKPRCASSGRRRAAARTELVLRGCKKPLELAGIPQARKINQNFPALHHEQDHTVNFTSS